MWKHLGFRFRAVYVHSNFVDARAVIVFLLKFDAVILSKMKILGVISHAALIIGSSLEAYLP